MDEDVATFHGPGWEFAGGLAVRGRGFDATGAEADLVELYRNVDTYESIIQTTRRLSGFFSAVRETPDAIYLVCDHARSIPLYFSDTATVAVSDTATGAATSEQVAQFDPITASEFVLTRYVTRGETLLPAVSPSAQGETRGTQRVVPGDQPRDPARCLRGVREETPGPPALHVRRTGGDLQTWKEDWARLVSES